MLEKHLISLYDGILLIFQIKNAIWELYGKIVFDLITKSVDQNLDVDFIRRWLIAKVCLLFV